MGASANATEANCEAEHFGTHWVGIERSAAPVVAAHLWIHVTVPALSLAATRGVVLVAAGRAARLLVRIGPGSRLPMRVDTLHTAEHESPVRQRGDGTGCVRGRKLGSEDMARLLLLYY